MRLKLLLFTLLTVLVLMAGCNKPENNQTGIPANLDKGNITTAKDFIIVHKDWTSRLEVLAAKTSAVHNSWINSKIDTEEYLTKLKEIYVEVKLLNNETDLKTKFNLSEEEKQKANFDTVSKTYQKASKDLNDFLYRAPRYTDEEIKTKYEEMIKANYNDHFSELKSLLKL